MSKLTRYAISQIPVSPPNKTDKCLLVRFCFTTLNNRDFARRGASCRLRREPRLAGVRHHNQVACAERNRHSGRAVAHYFLPAVGVDSGIKPLLIFRILYYNNVRSEYKRKVKSENKFNPLYNPRRVKSF